MAFFTVLCLLNLLFLHVSKKYCTLITRFLYSHLLSALFLREQGKQLYNLLLGITKYYCLVIAVLLIQCDQSDHKPGYFPEVHKEVPAIMTFCVAVRKEREAILTFVTAEMLLRSFRCRKHTEKSQIGKDCEKV